MLQPATSDRLLETWTRVGSLRIHAVEATGPALAPPLILVPGLGVSSLYMRPLARALAGHVRVLAPDPPGHGRSDAPARPLDVPALAEWLLAWMDANDIGRASLLGNSMGCQIAVDLAARWPERVERLVLVGPTLDPEDQSIAAMLARFAACAIGERFALIPVVAREYWSIGPRRFLDEVHAMRAYDTEATIARLRAPILIVRGRRDAVCSAEWCERLSRLAPHARCATIESWGHALNFSAAESLAPLVLDFLASGRAPSEPVVPADRPIWGRAAVVLLVAGAAALIVRRLGQPRAVGASPATSRDDSRTASSSSAA